MVQLHHKHGLFTGGALLDEIQPTETPLQLAAASGSVRMVELLLSSGASAFR